MRKVVAIFLFSFFLIIPIFGISSAKKVKGKPVTASKKKKHAAINTAPQPAWQIYIHNKPMAGEVQMMNGKVYAEKNAIVQALGLPSDTKFSEDAMITR